MSATITREDGFSIAAEAKVAAAARRVTGDSDRCANQIRSARAVRSISLRLVFFRTLETLLSESLQGVIPRSQREAASHLIGNRLITPHYAELFELIGHHRRIVLTEYRLAMPMGSFIAEPSNALTRRL